jgi:hypothetical protein
MRTYIGFDDTDVLNSDRGTGKLARWFEEKLPEGCRLWGVLRQQLPKIEGIPFTSNNSSACVVVDSDGGDIDDELIKRAVDHIQALYIEGSDPGLCVMNQDNGPAISSLMDFGRLCCSRMVSQKEAMTAARSAHLSGHGGTNDGIIGAAAGIGLTLSGWSGRFVEFGRLRDYGENVTVRQFEDNGIKVLSMDRNALVPWHDHRVETLGWVRPRLWGGIPVLPVVNVNQNTWRVVGIKKDE